MQWFVRLFTWYGGKYRMLWLLIMLLPDNYDESYELYGGSGAATLNILSGKKKVINEYDKDIYNIWKVMKDDRLSERFIDELQKVEYSETTFKNAKEAPWSDDAVVNAINTFILITQSFNATRKSFSKKNSANYVTTNYFNAVEAHKRLKDVEVTNRDAVEILKEIKDKKEAFVFLDPPYLHKYRGKGAHDIYGKEMNEDEHTKMLDVIKNAECKIMLCGYRGNGEDELYDRKLSEGKYADKWHCYLLTEIGKPGIKGKKAQEFIWVNYELPGIAKSYINVSRDYIKIRQNRAESCMERG